MAKHPQEMTLSDGRTASDLFYDPGVDPMAKRAALEGLAQRGDRQAQGYLEGLLLLEDSRSLHEGPER